MGFDVCSDKYVDVRYASERLFPKINSENFFKHIGEDQMVEIFATKFIHWSYEEEVRLLISFGTEPENGEICFYPYSDELQLREIIIGPRSDIYVEDIREAVCDDGVDVFQSRLGFKRFEVVRQQKRRLWNWRISPS